jgi:hypothetical protein
MIGGGSTRTLKRQINKTISTRQDVLKIYEPLSGPFPRAISPAAHHSRGLLIRHVFKKRFLGGDRKRQINKSGRSSCNVFAPHSVRQVHIHIALIACRKLGQRARDHCVCTRVMPPRRRRRSARIQTGHETGSSHVIYPRRGSIDPSRARSENSARALRADQLKVRENHDFTSGGAH